MVSLDADFMQLAQHLQYQQQQQQQFASGVPTGPPGSGLSPPSTLLTKPLQQSSGNSKAKAVGEQGSGHVDPAKVEVERLVRDRQALLNTEMYSWADAVVVKMSRRIDELNTKLRLVDSGGNRAGQSSMETVSSAAGVKRVLAPNFAR
jgi:hypothetical protein